jgi:hypothetical protein
LSEPNIMKKYIIDDSDRLGLHTYLQEGNLILFIFAKNNPFMCGHGSKKIGRLNLSQIRFS